MRDKTIFMIIALLLTLLCGASGGFAHSLISPVVPEIVTIYGTVKISFFESVLLGMIVSVFLGIGAWVSVRSSS